MCTAILAGCGALPQRQLAATDRPLDVAIVGDGLFLVQTPTGRAYTRGGHFEGGEVGLILEGLPVLGWGAGSEVAPLCTALPARVEGEPTTRVSLAGFLAADAPLATSAFVLTDPLMQSALDLELFIHSPQGALASLRLYFRRVASGTFEFHALMDGEVLTGGTPGSPTEMASGVLRFRPDGPLDSVTQTSALRWRGTQRAAPLAFDFGDPLQAGGQGVRGLVHAGGTQGRSTLLDARVDGFGRGALVGLLVDPLGTVLAQYSSGRTFECGQPALARFPNELGLTAISATLLTESPLSGPPSLSLPGTQGAGSLAVGFVERND